MRLEIWHHFSHFSQMKVFFKSFLLFLPFGAWVVRLVMLSLQKTKDLLNCCFLVLMRPPVVRKIKQLKTRNDPFVSHRL